MSNGDDAANEFWRCKYLKILEYAYQVLQNNKLHHAKIKRINKNIRRISKHNEYFVQVLKKHGDDFGLHCPSVWEKIAYPGAISEPLLDAKAQMKKPPNAFFLYCKENRDSVKKLIKEQPSGVFDARNEITKQLAKDWNALPQEEREKYFEKYRDNIESYEESIREERRKNKLMFAMTSSEDEEDDEFSGFSHPQYNQLTSSQPPLTPQTPLHNNVPFASNSLHHQLPHLYQNNSHNSHSQNSHFSSSSSSVPLPPNFLQLNQSAQLSESDEVFDELFTPPNGSLAGPGHNAS